MHKLNNSYNVLYLYQWQDVKALNKELDLTVTNKQSTSYFWLLFIEGCLSRETSKNSLTLNNGSRKWSPKTMFLYHILSVIIHGPPHKYAHIYNQRKRFQLKSICSQALRL